MQMQDVDAGRKWYQEARNLSWQVLLRDHITRLPVSVSDVCRKEAVNLIDYTHAQNVIHLLQMEHFCEQTDGFSFQFYERYYILYDEKKPLPRRRYTVAHELGHCLLDHLSKIETADLSTTEMEKQSNQFAARLLAPACVLWGAGVSSATEISEMCNISARAAEVRMARMEVLYARNEKMMKETGRNCFLSSPLERRVYENFQPFISAYRASKDTAPSGGPALSEAPVPSDQ